jgi:RHS repeat-associated protein
MQAGDHWQAGWKRDRSGLELQRELTGGVSVRTERDRFGQETSKSVGVRNMEQSARRYAWGVGNRLQSVHDEWPGKHTTFNYDAFDNLIRAEYTENNQTGTIYRAPDVIGNLFETPYCNDRRYDKGGRLTEDPNCFYHYDCEGNLIFKELKKPQGYSSLGKAALQKKYGIRFKATGTGWLYEWSAGGMLERVVNPQQGKVSFGYDALGRRIYKEVKHTRTHWLWDSNTPLHEWQTTEKEPLIDLVTWVFEEGTFVPAARITSGGSQSIVTDYLGTPVQMYDAKGEKIWEAQLDIYGRVRTFVGRSLSDCPFRYQGQYQDSETGLYYNRFRYYDPSVGSYISQYPIRLAGDEINLYTYVHNPNCWIDPNGLFGSGSGQHTAIVNVYDTNGNRVSRDILKSGNMTPDEKTLGFPESTLATHTEARAMKNIPLSEGQRMEIFGMNPPCNSCKGKMNARAVETGADITYIWKDKKTGEIKKWKACH